MLVQLSLSTPGDYGVLAKTAPVLKLAWLYRTLDGTNGKETTLKVESLPRISISI